MAILGLYLLGKSNASSSASPAEKLQGRDFYRFLGVFCSQISIINFILQYHSHSFTLVHTCSHSRFARILSVVFVQLNIFMKIGKNR